MFPFRLVLIAARSSSPARHCSRCELEIGGGGSGKRARLPFCTQIPPVTRCVPVSTGDTFGATGAPRCPLATRARTAAARAGPGPSACPRRVRADRRRAWVPCPRASGCPARCGRLGCGCGEGPPGAGSRRGPARCGRQAGPGRRSARRGCPGQRSVRSCGQRGLGAELCAAVR